MGINIIRDVWDVEVAWSMVFVSDFLDTSRFFFLHLSEQIQCRRLFNPCTYHESFPARYNVNQDLFYPGVMSSIAHVLREFLEARISTEMNCLHRIEMLGLRVGLTADEEQVERRVRRSW
jgi:hypothetical protein